MDITKAIAEGTANDNWTWMFRAKHILAESNIDFAQWNGSEMIMGVIIHCELFEKSLTPEKMCKDLLANILLFPLRFNNFIGILKLLANESQENALHSRFKEELLDFIFTIVNQKISSCLCATLEILQNFLHKLLPLPNNLTQALESLLVHTSDCTTHSLVQVWIIFFVRYSKLNGKLTLTLRESFCKFQIIPSMEICIYLCIKSCG